MDISSENVEFSHLAAILFLLKENTGIILQKKKIGKKKEKKSLRVVAFFPPQSA